MFVNVTERFRVGETPHATAGFQELNRLSPADGGSIERLLRGWLARKADEGLLLSKTAYGKTMAFQEDYATDAGFIACEVLYELYGDKVNVLAVFCKLAEGDIHSAETIPGQPNIL